MGRQALTAEDLLEIAERNNYTAGAHEERDTKRSQKEPAKKTKMNQDRTIDRYVAWYLGLIKKAYARDGRSPPTEEMARAECLRKDALVPSLAQIKDFMRFNVSLCKPRICDVPTVSSINTEAEWFFAGFTRATDTTISLNDRSEVYKWVRNILTQDSLVRKASLPKENFSNTDLSRLILAL